MPDETDRIPCRRCLLRDLSDDGYYELVAQYVDGMREDWKTPAAEYEQRLEICRQCTQLVNGICSLCGCFVELRAANHANHCAQSKEIW